MKILFFILLFLIQHAVFCEDQIKYVSSIAIAPKYHKPMVSDKVYFTYHYPTANSQQPTANSQQPTANSQQPTAKDSLMYTLLQKCNDKGWITKKTSDSPINDFVFDTEGKCNIQINITQKSLNDTQKIWVGSFVVKHNKIPMVISNRDIFIKLSKIDSLIDSPEYKDIYIEKFQDNKFKVEQYNIKRSNNLDLFITNNKNQTYKKEIQEHLLSSSNRADNTSVYPASELSHPYQWADHLLKLCNLSNNPKYQQQSLQAINEYINQKKKFLSQRHNKSLFYLYPNPINVYGIEIEKDWVSGLAQGYMLSAFSCLCEKTGDNRFCENATNIFNSYFDIKDDRDDNHNKLWFTYIDKHQFLWFQEVAQNQNKKKQFNILNGHLASIAGLYSYYRITKSPKALLLIRAGSTTTKRYLQYFRNKNTTLGYFLVNTEIADYGPARTIMELKWLSAITDDDYFKKMGNLFAADSQITTNEALLERY